MKKITFFIITLYCLSLSGQSLRERYTQSTAAYQAKDYPLFLKLSRELDSLRPSHPAYTYNLACAYALNNLPEKAIPVLRKAVLMNYKTDFQNDTDFAALKDLPDYSRLLQLKSELAQKKETSEKLLSLSEKELHPESLAHLDKAGLWLATSIRKRKIVSFDSKTGECTDWLSGENMLAVFSIRPDKNEKYLWVATAALPEMENFTKADEGKAEILKVEISTRKIVNRFPLAGNHVFGDLLVMDNGTVYISDSGTANIYLIENDTLSVWLDLEKEAFNLQGIAFNPDKGKIYISDYFRGILAIEAKNPQRRHWLTFPENTTVKGIDGLTFYNNSLIAVHNGVNPIRILRFFLDKNGDKISSYVTIDQNRPEFDEPALGIVHGKQFYFFANGPWKAYDKSFELDTSKFENPALFRFALQP